MFTIAIYFMRTNILQSESWLIKVKFSASQVGNIGYKAQHSDISVENTYISPQLLLGWRLSQPSLTDDFPSAHFTKRKGKNTSTTVISL